MDREFTRYRVWAPEKCSVTVHGELAWDKSVGSLTIKVKSQGLFFLSLVIGDTNQYYSCILLPNVFCLAFMAQYCFLNYATLNTRGSHTNIQICGYFKIHIKKDFEYFESVKYLSVLNLKYRMATMSPSSTAAAFSVKGCPISYSLYCSLFSPDVTNLT